jgi:type IV secretory pathway VirB10-like protein
MEAATATTPEVGVSTEDDPHASKLSPDDPRLKVARPSSRTLRMKPVLGAIAALLVVGGYTVLASVRKGDAGREIDREPPKLTERPSSLPAIIQEAPSTPEPPPPAPQLPLAVPAAASIAPPPRPDPRAQQALQEELAREAELVRTEAEARNSLPGPPPPLPVASPAGGAALAGQSPDAWDPNLQTRKNAFLDDPRLRADYLPTSLQPALSPYEIKATTVIPATLISGINSDLPGPIIAQVREQVYDTATGQHLLIPQGARLLASYDSMVAWGQERVLMCWNRLILPNGKSVNLQCMPAADLKGQAGLTDEVDNHWNRLLAAVGLSTVLSLGAQAAAGDPTGYQPNLAQQAARNAAGQINSAGQAVVQRQINIQPTITVRPGFGVNVIVTKDMVLEPYSDTPGR